MLTWIETILFFIAVAASIYYTYLGFRKVYLVVRRGQGDFPSQQQIIARLTDAAITWITTKPIWKTREFSSFFHGMVAWGFIFYFLVNFGDVLQGIFPIVFLGHNWLGNTYRFLADIFTASVLIGMVYFLIRRFVYKDKAFNYRDNIKLLDTIKQGGIRRDSLIVGVFILSHVGFRLLGDSFAVIKEGGDWGRPFAMLVGQLWSGWGETALTIGEHIGWWVAIGLILGFLPYFPYTKHFHLIMSGFNFLSKPQRTSLGTLDPINFDDESIEEFGVKKLEELPWTHLVDAYSCIMCNRCQDVCPAYLTGKELSPSALEVNKRYFINANLNSLAAGQASEVNLLDFAISESAVWACTACGACVDICPVGNEPMFDIMYMRRRQMLTENEFPSELKTTYRGMERNGNPWNISAKDRMKWAQGLDVPTIDDNPEPDVLWWVGCAPSYDPRAQEVAKSFAKVLNAAGVNYAVLGESERCTGDAARRSGNEYLFSEMAKANVEILNEVKPKRIVTTCPHCLHTIGKEYGQFGGNYEVIHHTQLLTELTAAKKISVQRSVTNPSGEIDLITFHDPCYLGRHNNILEAPRTALHTTDAFVVEMPRHGKQSFCCGAGGAQMWKEEEHGTETVNVARYKEAVATGAKTIAVGCPFCLTMMTDAAKQADQGVVVKDVVELIADRMVV
jgi:Fe-S oxidoreductase